MGDLTNIKINPFKGDVIDMLQNICKQLQAGQVYNPMAEDKIKAKIKELETAIWAIDESRVLDKE